MITVLAIMALGMLIGYVFKQQKGFLKLADKLTTNIIRLLLFMLGIGVGLNEKVIQNIDSIGLQATIISLGALLGSLLMAYLTYKFWNVESGK